MATTETRNKLIDPVCRREVNADSKYHSYYGNGMYYFCSQQDKDAFDKEPEKYAEFEPTSTSGGTCD